MPDDAQAQPTKPVKARYFTRARVMRRFLLLFGMYIGFCGAIAWFSVAPHKGGIVGRPAVSGLKFEDVVFHSSDGTKLSGWYIPATISPKGVVVLCHGVDGNRIGMFEPAMMLHKHGYATFIFDFRARGNSEGAYSTLGWKETDDLLAAVQMVKNRADMRGVPLGVMGHSMGGAVALMAAAQSPDIRAVIAESAFAQLDHAVHNHFKSIFGWSAPLFEYPSRWIGERLIGRSCADIAPAKVISRIAPRPVFLIQDTDDTLCPITESKELFDACGEPKQIWTVPHAGHIQAIELQPEEYERRIVAFFNANLK